MKLRYRWYGDLETKNKGNLEIKYKRNLFGWKKKIRINNHIISNTIEWKKINELISQDLPEKYKFYYKQNSRPQRITCLSRFHRFPLPFFKPRVKSSKS